jgi:hypothetical protein
MRIVGILALGLSLFGAAWPASAEVQLAIRDGRVTLVATDATVRQILTEWARVGQTKIVNVERIPGGPVSLQLTDVPESEALDLLLRSVTGYMAARRPIAAANLSRYDRIFVLPTAAVARVPTAAAAPPVFQQPFSPALQRPPGEQDGGDDGPSIAPPRGPLFPTFQSPQPGSVAPGQVFIGPEGGAQRVFIGPQGEQPHVTTPPPAGQPSITPFPGAVGTPRPGMVTPAPPGPGGQPGQPVQPGQPAPIDN